MNREEFIAAHPILDELESRGIHVVGGGNERKAKCPLHEDQNPSFSVNLDKQVWTCHAGCGGGSVIDLIAMLDGKTPAQVLQDEGDWSVRPISRGPRIFIAAKEVVAAPVPPPALEIDTTYSYTDRFGNELYQVVRYKPKTFRQRKPDGNGGWSWGMDGVERVLYNLPKVADSQEVVVVEGEKDADNLNELGFCATTNVGGAGKWLDGYTSSLAGKDVILCGDSDAPGKKHVELVFHSISDQAKSVKVISLPKPFKDVSEFLKAQSDVDASRNALRAIYDVSTPHVGGVRMSLFTMADLEKVYADTVRSDDCRFDFGKWLPGLKWIRPAVPGEVVLIIGDTGIGKTALLQSIAMSALPIPTLFFEMELPPELMFERFVAMKTGFYCSDVEKTYRNNKEGGIGREVLNHQFRNLFICHEAKLTLDSMEAIIAKSELKIGSKPKIVLVDYVQLMKGKGERYERISDIAEGVKVIAKSTRTIIFITSQVHRPNQNTTFGIHSAKDSGALENSAGVVMGAWRDAKDPTLMKLKVFKSTKGGAGTELDCNYDGAKMKITERSQIKQEDLPK